MDVQLLSSSFLLPGNKAWHCLLRDHSVSYLPVGRLTPAICDQVSTPCLIWVVFQQDLFPLGQGSPELIQSLLEPLCTLLRSYKGRVVVAYSCDCGAGYWATPSSLSLGRYLHELAGQYSNLHLLDLDRLFGGVGTERAFDFRNYYACNCRLSPVGLTVLAQGLCRLLGRLQLFRAKVLVLDCDCTLWGGVLGEVGFEGILLGGEGVGAAHVDFQESIKRVAAEGVLIAIASKNDLADVLQVFENHPEMRLRVKDIAAFEVGWGIKSDALLRLAAKLSLSPDSLVFWDDSSFERAMVRSALPTVRVPEPPTSIWEWPGFLDQLDDFAAAKTTEEDKLRSASYDARARLMEEMRGLDEPEEYLMSIKMEPSFMPLELANLARAEQLCSRTNQFNLRTQRYTQAELKEMLGSPDCYAWTVRLKDRFAEHGLIGLVLCRKKQDGVAFLDTFLLSCRVLGRHLETWTLYQAMQELRRLGYRHCVGQFLDTSRNQPAKSFLQSHGFERIDGHGEEGDWYMADLETLTFSHLGVFAS